MPEGQIAEIYRRGNDMVVETVPAKDLAMQLAADDTVHTLVWQVTRIGTLRFVTMLEHLHYPPADRARAERFRMRICKWQGIEWELSTYPAADGTVVDALIMECQLRKANGVPTRLFKQAGGGQIIMIGVIHRDHPLEPGCERFPIFNPRVWTLENAAASPVYSSANAGRLLAEKELTDVRRFLEERGVKGR